MMYDVEFSYNLPEWGNVELDADNPEDADRLAFDYIRNSFPDAVNIEITSVREVKEDE